MKTPRRPARPPLAGWAATLAVALASCAVGPDYVRPATPAPASFKESAGPDLQWLPAAPADTLERGPWWQLFGDETLNSLAAQVDVSNQNVAAALAAYAQANALVSEQRAGLFPQLALNATARRSGDGAAAGASLGPSNSLQLGVAASWAPDVWGSLRRAVEGAQAGALASQADLAAAKLSAQGTLATDYFALRDADAELALLDDTVQAYERALKITQNRYAAGIAPRTDVLQAQTQLASTRADRVALRSQRAQFEHALAVLVGQAPGDFSVAAGAWNTTVPAIPLGVPSALLQRRPDIAAAERAVAQANAQIAIQRAGYFPSLNLSASAGHSASRAGDLFLASTRVWSLGLSAAQTLFDAGATGARVEQAVAARDAAAARYRQTVLGAFQSVEDQLASAHALADQATLRLEASQAADLTEQQLLNRYQAGQVAYTDIVTAQASALSARRTLAQLTSSRQATAIALIQSLGGGWHVAAEPAPAAPP